MTSQECEHAKTLSGYKLWSVMKWAERMGKKDVFNTCYERARELTKREYGRWEEAKGKLDSQNFPQWEKVTKTLTARLLGYLTEIHQEVDDANNIVSQYMVVINHKTNGCYLRWFVKNGEVLFS